MNSWLSLVLACSLPVFCSAKSCDQKARGLGSRIGGFLSCSVNHAVPVTVCLGCHENFTLMASDYAEFMSNPSCAKRYTQEDRFDVIQTAYVNVASIWEKGFCSDCYDTNGTESLEVSHIMNIATDLDNCMVDKGNLFCNLCLANYENLNIFYNEFVKKHKDKICFDVQDKVNRTRSKWSENCCPRKASLTIFFSTIPVAFLLSIIFYGTSVGVYRRTPEHSALIDEESEQNIEEVATSDTWAGANTQVNLTRNAPANLLDEIIVRRQPGPSSTLESNAVVAIKDINLKQGNQKASDDDDILQL